MTLRIGDIATQPLHNTTGASRYTALGDNVCGSEGSDPSKDVFDGLRLCTERKLSATKKQLRWSYVNLASWCAIGTYGVLTACGINSLVAHVALPVGVIGAITSWEARRRLESTKKSIDVEIGTLEGQRKLLAAQDAAAEAKQPPTVIAIPNLSTSGPLSS